ncbi:hypothetical protein Zmor_006243 [Zophobas morio]|nr:hypothetical protein Zmor_006243 [Zophobas morio]
MSDYLQKFDRKMASQKRKILLFLDNAASHPKNLKLKNIKIIFLPPNTTSVCQPLDQGIIKNFKIWYRSMIVKHVLARMDEATSLEDLIKKINLLDVIYFIQKAWEKVTPATITNSFQKEGFRFRNDTFEKSIDDAFEHDDDIPLAVIAEITRGMKRISSNVGFDDFVNFDNDLCINDERLEINEPSDVEIEENEEEEGEATTEYMENVSSGFMKTNREAIEGVQKLKHFCASVSLNQSNLKQTTLQDYFNQV